MMRAVPGARFLSTGTSTPARWGSLDREPGGLAQMAAFASKHGKPLNFPTAPGTRETQSRSASATGMA